MTTSKSPRRVLLTAYDLAAAALPRHWNKYSRKDYTLPQLFACLVLKEYEKKDYRGAEHLLGDWPALRREIGLEAGAPDHSTLQRAAARLLAAPRARRLMDEVVRFARLCRMMGRSVALAAMDASGFESRHVSAYFVRRRAGGRRLDRSAPRPTQELTYRRFPKLALVVDTRTHLALSFAALRGPGPDQPHFERALFDAWRRVPGRVYKLAADAGYDAEWAHDVARRDMGVRTLIPPRTGRPRPRHDPRPPQRWRGLMHRLLRTKRSRRRHGYTQRWQAETVNSMIKRNQGSALRARSDRSQSRELALRVLTHNVALLRPEGRDRAGHCSLRPRCRAVTWAVALVTRLNRGARISNIK